MQSMIHTRSAALALTLVLFGGGCSSTDGGQGSHEYSQVREVAHFSKVRVAGPVDLVVRVGAPLGLSVRVEERDIGALVTEVEEGTLVISYPRKGAQASVQVGLPHLFALECSGGAHAKLSGLRGGTLELDLHGNGSIWAEGSVERLVGTIDGAGDLQLAELSTRFAEVRVNGPGEAEVRVSGSLDAVVQGGGDVLYHGDPIVTADTSGSGKVAPRR